MERFARIAQAIGIDVRPTIRSCGTKVVLLTERQVSMPIRLQQFMRSKFG
jgi:hypothetical protein